MHIWRALVVVSAVTSPPTGPATFGAGADDAAPISITH